MSNNDEEIMRTAKNVTLPDTPDAERTVAGVIYAVGVHRTVGYTVKGYDMARGTVTYQIEGPSQSVHLAYEYGVQNRVW